MKKFFDGCSSNILRINLKMGRRTNLVAYLKMKTIIK